MLQGLSITCLDRFLGRIFSQFVQTRMGMLGIHTFSRAYSFPGSFWPCAGPQGVNYPPWPVYHLVWTPFWASFFHNCADKTGGAWDRYLQQSLLITGQLLGLCWAHSGPAGCELYSLAWVSPGLVSFLACISSQFVRTTMGVLGMHPFSRACWFLGCFWTCTGP